MGGTIIGQTKLTSPTNSGLPGPLPFGTGGLTPIKKKVEILSHTLCITNRNKVEKK